MNKKDQNKSVSDGRAGAETRVFPLFNSSMMDQPTDQPTNGRMDNASYRLACLQLKMTITVKSFLKIFKKSLILDQP